MIQVGNERKIIFDRELRYQRQSVYDITNYDSETFTFDSGQKNVYKNFNLSIFIDDKCNADCKFCVAQLRYEHKGLLYQKDHILNDNDYLKKLREVLEAIRPLNPSISITGGEPTISNRIVPVLELVNELGFRKRTITTNGSGLFRVINGKTILKHLIDNQFDHLNISRVCIDEDLNKQIMRYEPGIYCSNDMIKQIAKELKDKKPKIRMSCILLKQSVHTVKQIKEYVDFYHKYGINNFIFRQLMEYDHNAVNIEKIKYCDENKVDLNDIWEEMEQDTEILPYMNILGYYYYVELYNYHNCRIASESADLEQQYKEKSKHPDFVYEMIFHTNGNLCGSWIPEEEILLK